MGTTFNKAIVGLVVPIITYALAKFGLNITDEFTLALTGVVTAIVVWLVPNKAAS